MNTAVKRERDGKTIESDINLDKLYRESPKIAEDVLELQGFYWLRKISILYQNGIDNQKRDIQGTTTDAILDLEDEDVREKLIVVEKVTKEQALTRH